MACAGRQKTCSVVPSNHFGPIPGVEVGQSWKFRVGVSIIAARMGEGNVFTGVCLFTGGGVSMQTPLSR